jgi:hypothetical protein
MEKWGERMIINMDNMTNCGLCGELFNWDDSPHICNEKKILKKKILIAIEALTYFSEGLQTKSDLVGKPNSVAIGLLEQRASEALVKITR